jgi:TolB-like protein
VVVLSKARIFGVLLLGSVAAARASGLDDLLRKLESDLRPPEKSPMAVLPFIVKGADTNLGFLVAESAVDRFVRSEKVSLIDRMNFKSIVEEFKLSDSELMNPDSAIPIGKLMGAHLILTGTVTRVYGKDQVHARIIDVASTKVLAAVSGDFGDAALHAMVEPDTSLHPALFRSAVCPGWGQFWTGHPMQGGIATTAFVGSLGAFAASIVLWDQRAVRLRDFRNDTAIHLSAGEYERRERELSDDQNEAVDWMKWTGTSIGAVWGLNMIDALWLAHRHRRQERSLYFALQPSPGTGPRDFSCSLVMRF